MNRRSILLGASALASAGLLAGCGIVTSNSVNGVTTVSVNVAKLDAYALAIQNGADALLANPLVASGLGVATTTVIAAALASLGAAINAINNAAKGSVSLTFAPGSAPAALVSLQSDAVTVFDALKTGLAAAAITLSANVASAFDALQTVVALLLAVIPSAAGAKAVALPAMKMTEGQALAVLHAN